MSLPSQRGVAEKLKGDLERLGRGKGRAEDGGGNERGAIGGDEGVLVGGVAGAEVAEEAEAGEEEMGWRGGEEGEEGGEGVGGGEVGAAVGGEGGIKEEV